MFPLISGDSASNSMVDGKFTGFTFSYQFLTSSHWFPLVGCGVPVGLNDGSMNPSLAYV